MSNKNRRAQEFELISKHIETDISFINEMALVVNKDSLDVLKNIPDNSVSLILTDPPYHSTKKKNITNDDIFTSDDDFLAWINKFASEWRRIIKPNGSLFIFCSSAMSAKLEIMMSEHFNVLSNIVWTKPNEPGFDGWKGKMKKEALRQWYPHSERILFMEPAIEGNLKRSWFGSFLKETRLKCKLSGHQLTELVGAYGKVNHGGAVSNWEAGRNVPSTAQYKSICDAFIRTGFVDDMPNYEDVIRKFSVTNNIEFTDVWNFFSVRAYKGKHPAEKPIDLLEHCINATTFENDIVLDCFAGSGSTAIAALNLNRHSISIEIEPEWANIISTRLKNYPLFPQNLQNSDRSYLMKLTLQSAISKSLFD